MPPLPPAFAAVERFPSLRPVALSIAAQARRVAERLERAVPRVELLAEFDTLLGESGGNLLLVQGPAGTGATTFLCQLAALRPYPLWLPSDDYGQGLAALCAQVIALHDLPLALVPPFAGRDAQTLEHLLGEAASRRPANDPLILLIDTLPDVGDAALHTPFPRHLPPNVVVVYASEREAPAPIEPAARLRLPSSGPVLIRELIEAAMACKLPRATAVALAAHSGRSFLYITLASGLLETGLVRRRSLPEGLDALYHAWWNSIGTQEQQLAWVLAAAGELLPIMHAAALTGLTEANIAHTLTQWAGLVECVGEAAMIAHPPTRAFIAAQGGVALAEIHSAFVALAHPNKNSVFDQNAASESYFTRQLARHIALSTPVTRAEFAPLLVGRSWTLAQERRTGDLFQAARDAEWTVRIALEAAQLDQIVRATVLGGTLATMARQLTPELVAQAFLDAVARGEPRDGALRHVREVIDQLPNGREKALVLRRLGEVCFEHGMRTSAMRMLSEALDFEVPGLPRSWRDEREEAQAALARAAIAAGAPDRALGITVRIGHAERRGMIETEVVRWLLAQANLTRAEEVAQAIGHEHTHEWALAEVAAGHARAGHVQRFREVLGTLKTETAIAWARAELACDMARHGDTSAVEQVALIANERLRDQALGLVARALVEGQQAPTAIMAARLITGRAGRARALIDLAQTRAPHAAAALAHAAEDVRTLAEDERTPLVVLLASAYATIGDVAAALQAAERLDQGEERDRAHSRVATALARAGELETAARVVAAIPDDDERGWTERELANAYAKARQFERAAALVAKIVDDEQRARAQADLCIAQARNNRVAGALTGCDRIVVAAERARALSSMTGAMIARGFVARADAVRDTIAEPIARSRYVLALADALAAAGRLDEAEQQIVHIPRALDQSRALIICARACATIQRKRATEQIGHALQLAAQLGRPEIVVALVAAADVLATLGGPELLLAAAHALDEVDSWWG